MRTIIVWISYNRQMSKYNLQRTDCCDMQGQKIGKIKNHILLQYILPKVMLSTMMRPPMVKLLYCNIPVGDFQTLLVLHSKGEYIYWIQWPLFLIIDNITTAQAVQNCCSNYKLLWDWKPECSPIFGWQHHHHYHHGYCRHCWCCQQACIMYCWSCWQCCNFL